MAKINCEVSNCSHNNSGMCYANIVSIVGSSAQKENDTCCSSFLNDLTYAELTNDIFESDACDSLKCSAETCAHNKNKLCTLENIQVSGSNAEYYTQTDCASFFNKDVKV
jgi:hypothetical protein